MDALTKQFASFLASECGVTGPSSYGDLSEKHLNIWRAEYCREYPDVLDDVNYVEHQQLAARLAAVFSATDDRLKLAALAALGKLVADVIAAKADEAGNDWVGEAWYEGYFAELRQERIADMRAAR